MQLIILASGRGSRLKKKTTNIPKTLVKVNQKPILDYMLDKFNLFKKVLIVGGYKYKQLTRYENKKIKVINNKEFLTTNMVYSAFKPAKYINSDVIICYSDIIFSKKILKTMTKKNSSHLPLYKNWLNNWKQRMNLNNIKKDAEDLVANKKHIISIGEKIKKKLPRYQYMGIIKLKKIDYFKLNQYFIKINKNKIDMTSFLSRAIKNKVVKLEYFITTDFWTEIDNQNDIKAAEKMLKETNI